MAYVSKGVLDRSLTDAEEAQFRKHARENDPPAGVDWSVLHPVCREEWRKRGICGGDLEECQLLYSMLTSADKVDFKAVGIIAARIADLKELARG